MVFGFLQVSKKNVLLGPLFYLPSPTAQFLSHRKGRQSLPVEHVLGPTAGHPDGFRFVSCPSVSAPHSQDWQPHLNESKKKGEKKEILFEEKWEGPFNSIWFTLPPITFHISGRLILLL